MSEVSIVFYNEAGQLLSEYKLEHEPAFNDGDHVVISQLLENKDPKGGYVTKKVMCKVLSTTRQFHTILTGQSFYSVQCILAEIKEVHEEL